jgi:pimeloyl-ACP methyl ester carboxylesterase
VPIAEWTFDTDSDASTGVSAWPAAAAVRSPGIEQALVVSSRGAWLVAPGTGARTDVSKQGGSVIVDKASQSFVVKIPRTLLPVRERWRVRLASGVADAAGSSFATPSLGLAALPATGLPRTYNVTFRRVDQEPPVYDGGTADAVAAALQHAILGLPLLGQMGLDGQARFVTGNFWMDDDQADTLASGADVSKFSQIIDWRRLANKALTPEPQPTGYSTRWYVSRLFLGGGLATGEMLAGALSGELASGIPTTLTHAQPYAVYVPASYSSQHPTPLTWVLHSLEGNYNQYGGLDPHLMQQLCEERDSICATTEGYGPAGGYAKEAETDYWQVWRALADAYRLDPDRTVLTGYSMGGFGTNSLGFAHPDLYAGGMVLDGATPDGPFANVRWVPYVIDNTIPDELVPPTSALSEANGFDGLGQRYRLFIHAGADHLVYATQDRFDDSVAALGRPVRTTAPGTFDYQWDPAMDDAGKGIGVTGDYWVDHLAARVKKSGTPTSVVARDEALPDRKVTVQRHSVSTVSTPVSGITRGLTWTLGARPAARQNMMLRLTNVARLSVDTAEAKLAAGTIELTTDGATALRLTRLPARTRVTAAGAKVSRSRRTFVVQLAKGTSTVSIGAPRHR